MSTVADILKSKGRQVYQASPGTGLSDALTTMSANNIGCLIVVEDGFIVGVFSERDYARRSVKGMPAPHTPIGELMSREVFCVEPATSLNECMALMTERRVRHLPVLKNGEVMGLISIGDVVNSIISEQQFTIEELEKYIYDTGYAGCSA